MYFLISLWILSNKDQKSSASVDFEDAEDVIGYRVETEGRARNGLQLSVFLQPQEAGHLARLHKVERVRPRRGGGPVALHTLQLLGPRTLGHNVQLHILRLLLVEQHLKRQIKSVSFSSGEISWDTTRNGSFIWSNEN